MAREAEEEKAEKPAVIRAEEARLKAEADERAAAEEAGVVTREAQNSVAKAKGGSGGQRSGHAPGGQGQEDRAPGGQDQGGGSPPCPGS